MSILLSAARLAALWHKDQKRKNNGRPYLTHLIRTAGRVLTLPDATIDMGAATFLHDSVEDQAPTVERHSELTTAIRENCGERVLVMVLAMTNASKGLNLPRAERKRIDRNRLSQCDRQIKLIKLIDRIDNLNESVTDVLLGLDTNFSFNHLYADESFLLGDALEGTDLALEQELNESAVKLHNVCSKAELNVVT